MIAGFATKNQGWGCNRVGNPCNPATGNKFQSEVDFSYGDLGFTRHYNSLNLVNLGLGQGWRTSHQPRIVLSQDTITVVSLAGTGQPWLRVGGEWQGDPDSEITLEQVGDEFIITYPDTRLERYNIDGQLIMKTSKNGHDTVYSYNDNAQLAVIENNYGRKILFSYSNGLLETVTDPEGATYRYGYDNLLNLVSVTFPDTTPETDLDNPSRIYHYENEDFPSHLTGITDENGDRYATWSYNGDGRAISSEHSQTTNASGQERVELDFHGEN